jgi:putative oxidoreductase
MVFKDETLYSFQEYSLFLLRLVIVAIFLYHGYPKATQWSMAIEKFEAMGFPGILGPVVGIAEVVAGGLLLIGLFSRWSSIVLIAIIAVATVGVQIPGAIEGGKLLTAGLERDLLIFVGLAVLISFGSGALTLEGSQSA